MTAFNVVRFRVKPGFEEDFLEVHRNIERSDLEGYRRGALIKTGDRSYCIVGEWNDFSCIERSREKMIAVLDQMRHMLEDLGGGLGVTDPVSGEVVQEIGPSDR